MFFLEKEEKRNAIINKYINNVINKLPCMASGVPWEV